MKTTFHANAATLNPEWLHVSAKGQVLGRLAAQVARILMGKHKPTYTPHVDTGDFVVITDAEAIVLTGRKEETKVYRHHTGWIGHLVERPIAELRERRPEEIIELAVRRMLPKTRLGRKMFSKLKVYRGGEHPHGAQQPRTIQLQGTSRG